MIAWWNELSTLNQVFYCVATFFSVLFLWQFISSLIGLSGGEADIDTGADADVDADIDVDGDLDLDDIEAHSIEEAGESVMAFRILSVRAIVAFFTLFSWAAALYLDAWQGQRISDVLIRATIWGLAAWVLVAVLVHWMRKLAETGTMRLRSCVSNRGTVYLDIPADGQGEIRVNVGGRITLVRARGAGGAGIEAGTPVRVVRLLNSSSVEVQQVKAGQEQPAEEGEQ